MKTIEVIIDQPLLTAVDRVVEVQNTTRSAFVRSELRLALKQRKVIEMERRHAEDYARHSVEPGDFVVWVEEQAWGEPRVR